MAVLVTVLVISCSALVVACAGLAWHSWEQTKTVDYLTRVLMRALEPKTDAEILDIFRKARGDAHRLPAPGAEREL